MATLTATYRGLIADVGNPKTPGPVASANIGNGDPPSPPRHADVLNGWSLWKNDDNVSIVLHKQERASWLDFLGFSLLFIDIEITLIWMTFGFRLLLFFILLEIPNKSSEKVYVTEIKSPHFLSYSENRAVFLLRRPFFISRIHLHYYRTS